MLLKILEASTGFWTIFYNILILNKYIKICGPLNSLAMVDYKYRNFYYISNGCFYFGQVIGAKFWGQKFRASLYDWASVMSPRNRGLASARRAGQRARTIVTPTKIADAAACFEEQETSMCASSFGMGSEGKERLSVIEVSVVVYPCGHPCLSSGVCP